MDAIQFFANSTNAVQVFEALAEGSATSSGLEERTNASRSTVLRILDRGESRGWVYSEGSRYEVTELGRKMIEEFTRYRETVQGVQRLGRAIEALPEPAHSLDFRHLRDADLTLQTDDQPFARFDRGLYLIREADTCRWLASVAPLEYMRGVRDGVEERGVTAGGVISAELAETLREDPERAEPWYAFADQVWVYDGHVPLSMELVDDTVLVWMTPTDEDRWDGAALLESDHPAVRSWAESLYEEYRRGADPLDPATLARY
jgi:predicted transcriptional regulator